MSSDLDRSDDRDETDRNEARRDEPGRDVERRNEGGRGEADRGGDGTETADDLAAQIDLLAAENHRLRREYTRTRLTSYRRTALGLLAVGAVAILGAFAVPDSRTVLLALGATGLFGAVLTYYLTPERFIAAGTSERVYDALGENGDRLVAELGLGDVRVYVPAPADSEASPGVRLFVPQRSEYVVPDADLLASLFVVGDDRERGVSLSPTGGSLYREFRTAMAGGVPERPDALAEQLADALVEGFELADGVASSLDPEGGRATFEVVGSAYGAVDRFDHPIPSFLGVGLAAGLDVPVTADVTTAEDGTGEYLVTCEWDPSAVGVERAE